MKKVIILLLFSIVIIAILPVFLPKTIHEEVEYIYDANPKKVYDYFNNLKKMSQWFNWGAGENDIEKKYSATTQGVGAEYWWGKSGKKLPNSVTITEGKELQFVGYQLKFDNYDGNTSEAIFQILDDGKVKVIWTFDSAELSYPYQVYNFIMGFKVKNNLKKGLLKLETLLQQTKSTEEEPQNNRISLITQPYHRLLGVVQTVAAKDQSEYKTAVEESIGLVESYLLDGQNVPLSELGKEVIYTIKKDNNEYTFMVGFFVNKNIPTGEEMESVEVPASRCLTMQINTGETPVEAAYHLIETYAQQHKLHLAGQNFWQELNGETTQIYVPVEGN